MTYANIFSHISGLLPIPEFAELKENKSFHTIMIFDQLAARVAIKPDRVQISFPTQRIDIPEMFGLEYKIMADGNTRFEFHSMAELSVFDSLFTTAYDSLRDTATVEVFGCCSSFTNCSDARKCLHEKDKEYLGCLYRKNLEAGRIFYGKNRNTD